MKLPLSVSSTAEALDLIDSLVKVKVDAAVDRAAGDRVTRSRRRAKINEWLSNVIAIRPEAQEACSEYLSKGIVIDPTGIDKERDPIMVATRLMDACIGHTPKRRTPKPPKGFVL